MITPANEVMSLDQALYRAEGYTIKKFNSHHLFEDLLQEALVVCWKGYQEGLAMQKICVNIKYRCLDLLTGKRKDQWLGHATEGKVKGAAKQGKQYSQSSGEETRRKIREYIDSYTRLHGHRPSTTEIATHVGVSGSTIKQHLQRLYLFTGNTEFSLTSLDAPRQVGGEDVRASVIDSIKYGYAFEEELVTKMDTRNLMNSVLDEREKTWLYLAYFEQKSQQEIADLYGYSHNLVGLVLRKAKRKLREAGG